MSVKRDEKGRWTVRIYIRQQNGKTRRIQRTSAKWTRRQAEKWERDTRQAVADGTFDQPETKEESSDLTLQDFVEARWLPTYPEAAGNRPKTILARKWALKHILPELGADQIAQIGAERIDLLLATLRRKGLSPKSVKDIVCTLRRVLASAQEWGLLDALPRFPKLRVPAPSFDHLSVEESRAVINAAADQEERAILLFALHTGARSGEQVALQWGDLDWRRREVIIRRNRPAGQDVVGPTKGSKERRVPLTRELADTLKRHRHLRNPLVFCHDDGARLEAWHLQHLVERCCRKAGVRRVRWHDLRHSFASQAVARGVPLPVVQAWLGHTSIVTTMRYAHFAPSAGHEWIKVLEGNNDIATTAGKKRG